MVEEIRKKLGDGRLTEVEGIQALLIGVYRSTKEKQACIDHLVELERLCDTYGLSTVKAVFSPLRKIDSSTYLGKGKVQEIQDVCESQQIDIDIVVFDDEISPQQQRNLEKILKKIVIDRTELILGVFAQRARTKEAKLQVQLAQFRYQLPRLKRLWTHLERQRVSGKGGGYLKGMGERQIEVDRRLLKEKIHKLQTQLQQIQKQRQIQRKTRAKTKIPTFSIVGYTNAGKSTLFKTLTSEEVFIEDKLFATLDTTTRYLHLPGGQKVLLIDTVGFIRKIPTSLIASFKSTLEEAVHTDILLHVIDSSSCFVIEQAKQTMEVLEELKVKDRPIITVINKVDQVEKKSDLIKLRVAYPHTVEVSAKHKTGLKDLLEKMEEILFTLKKTMQLKIPQSQFKLISQLMKEGRIISREYEGNDVLLTAQIPDHLEHAVKSFIID